MSEDHDHIKPASGLQPPPVNACPIGERIPDEEEAPVVSILCLTYNHEKYIRDCLEGFLMQETTFQVEILVHDDASTDATPSILEDYYRRYPHVFRNVLQSENQYSRNIMPSDILAPLARGRYIARCEGDDFWTDPHKLQIQVDFLDSHPDYVVSGHASYAADEKGNLLPTKRLKKKNRKDGEKEDLILTRQWLDLRTMVYRNILSCPPPEKKMVQNGDNFLLSLLGHHGKSKFHTEIQPACYRLHGGGIWSKKSDQEKNAMKMNSYYWMYRYYQRVGQTQYAAHYFRLMTRRSAELIDTATLVRKTLERVTGFRALRDTLRRISRSR